MREAIHNGLFKPCEKNNVLDTNTTVVIRAQSQKFKLGMWWGGGVVVVLKMEAYTGMLKIGWWEDMRGRWVLV